MWKNLEIMKSSLTVVSGTACFVFGMLFYHYSQPSIPRLFNDLGTFARPLIIQSSNYKRGNANVAHNCSSPFPIEQLVKGPIAQNEPRLLSYIRQHFLHPPSTKAYNLSHPDSRTDPSMGQSKIVLRALKYMRHGFFIEAGALDGETRSNSLLLERLYGWRGLLVEGDPKNFELLQEKNRKAWSSPSCLATQPYPHEALYKQAFNRGHITEVLLQPQETIQKSSQPISTTVVQCFPVFSILSALNVSHVHYFSLDVEGSELRVLETIPFDKIKIDIFSIEFLHSPGGREGLREFMMKKNYRIIGEVRDRVRNWANDLMFMHNSLYRE